jgi:pantoate--beta-alanine ligase
MQVVETIIDLRTRVRQWRAKNEIVAFVPTMGNLHEGHLSLVREALTRADRVVVSIFVNPLQFNDSSDLNAYPRTLEQDIHLLSEQGCDLVFTPNDKMIYPHGMNAQTVIHVPDMDDKLCGLGRPGHFDGVATVVTKLFNMVEADMAVFGEKDYQQLQLIRRLVADLNMPISIIGSPTFRTESGLAMSSRNNRLSEQGKTRAAKLYQTLQNVQQGILKKQKSFSALCADALVLLKENGFEPEYVEIRRSDDLALASEEDQQDLRIFAAAWLENVRLIDNIPCNLA